MPFALLIIGIFLLVSAVRGTSGNLFALIQGDFTTQPSFIYWAVAILLIGALGYIPKAKPISTALLGLLVVVLFLAKGDPNRVGGGFFEKFTAGLVPTAQPATGTTGATGTTSPQAQMIAQGVSPLANVLPILAPLAAPAPAADPVQATPGGTVLMGSSMVN